MVLSLSYHLVEVRLSNWFTQYCVCVCDCSYTTSQLRCLNANRDLVSSWNQINPPCGKNGRWSSFYVRKRIYMMESIPRIIYYIDAFDFRTLCLFPIYMCCPHCEEVAQKICTMCTLYERKEKNEKQNKPEVTQFRTINWSSGRFTVWNQFFFVCVLLCKFKCEHLNIWTAKTRSKKMKK